LRRFALLTPAAHGKKVLVITRLAHHVRCRLCLILFFICIWICTNILKGNILIGNRQTQTNSSSSSKPIAAHSGLEFRA
jgi:hypothetical protein